jgi:ribosomal protein S18 acetylase RimI-like enzyme
MTIDVVNDSGVLRVELLDFDSKLFGASAGRISELQAADEAGYRELLDACQRECRVRKVRHLVRRLPVGRFAEVWALEAAGYRQVDVSVLFERSGAPPLQASSPARPVRPDEHGRLAEKFARSFTLTRFAVDPFCSEAAATELHRQWIENSCRGRADAVLVVESEGELSGFVTCRVDAAQSLGNIELIAVDGKRRGEGLGKSLVAGALAWFQDRVSRVQVRTQLNNAVAIALYQNQGFRLLLGELTYSRTFEDEKASS